MLGSRALMLSLSKYAGARRHVFGNLRAVEPARAAGHCIFLSAALSPPIPSDSAVVAMT